MADDFPITPNVAAAYYLCERKAFLLQRGEQGEPAHQYVLHKDAQAAASLTIFVNSSKQAGLRIEQYSGVEPSGKADVYVQVSVKAGDLQATVDALVCLEKPVKNRQQHYEPHLAIGCRSVANEDKVRLAFMNHVLEHSHQKSPQTGVIINDAGDTQRIKLAKLVAYLKPVIEKLKEWKAVPATTAPPILLNQHCPICPFMKKCLEQAERDDSLTLLDRMTQKIMKKYQKKGIFTITQLSYVFKPRRRSKRQSDRPVVFNLELQALALRTGKIYVHQLPIIPQSSKEIYLDIEGVPDHGSHYLIGLVIRSNGTTESHSLWADSSHDEKRILEQFLAVANRYPDAPIYHYGSYEPKALLRMAKAAGVNIDPVIHRLVNVTTFIFGKVYFPARSNTLKELGRLLGATWSSPVASGLQ